jgi:hypothetical protein
VVFSLLFHDADSLNLKLGGRQVDGAIPSLLALEMIMKSPKIKAAQQSEKLTILFDSGIRTGSDIIKALALGAQAVLCELSWCLHNFHISEYPIQWVALGCMVQSLEARPVLNKSYATPWLTWTPLWDWPGLRNSARSKAGAKKSF